MPEVVVDASALLALLNAEPGAESVAGDLSDAAISAVNLSEVVAKLSAEGIQELAIRQILEPLGLEVIPFDEEQAYQAGFLRAVTKDAGLSLGDRGCLSLSRKLNLPALTADKTWLDLRVGVKIKTIR